MLRFHGSRDKQSFELVGHNSRLDELQAALLRARSSRTSTSGARAAGPPGATTRTRASASSSRCPVPAAGADPAWHLYVVRHARADALGAALQRGGHRAARPTTACRSTASPRCGRGRPRGELPGTDEAARTHLAIPMSPVLSPGAGRPRSSPRRAMRAWIDLTNSPHVLVMRPVIEALERRGAEVQVTARDFAQTLGLLERFGIAHEAIGRHRGGRLAAKGLGLASRSLALARWARGRRFDVALGHGSNDVTVAAKLLGIPCATTFDYEWATVQHTVNCRLARAVVVPEAIPPARLARYGATPAKLRRYPGLKEEYYLADFEPDPAVLAELGLDAGAPARRRPHAARGLALPPLRAPAVRAPARAPARAGADRRAAAHARAARRARRRGRLRRPRARGRRAVPRRPARTSSCRPAGR